MLFPSPRWMGHALAFHSVLWEGSHLFLPSPSGRGAGGEGFILGKRLPGEDLTHHRNLGQRPHFL